MRNEEPLNLFSVLLTSALYRFSTAWRKTINFWLVFFDRERPTAASDLLVKSVTECAIFMVDVAGRVRSWNRGAERITKLPAPQSVGCPLRSFFPAGPDQRGEVEQALEEASRSGSAFFDIWLDRADGQKFWAEVSIAAMRTPDSKLLGYSVVLRDGTEQKVSEDKLRRRARQLARSNAELERFAYVASHDLKEPLRMVSSYTQLLRKCYADRLDEDANLYIHYAVSGVDRMYSLINDLLEYSKVGKEGAFAPVDCSGILQNVRANLEATISEAGAVIEATGLPVVIGIRVSLYQLFQNLLGNALKFRKPGQTPHISITCIENANYWLFSVADDGIGIDPPYSDKIFEIFQRLHSREEYPGSGIGLAVCKKIVEKHGGRIWIESKLGEGTTFFFTLLKCPDNDELDSASEKPSPA